MDNMRLLLEEYCSLTGRPAATITVDEFVKLGQFAMEHAPIFGGMWEAPRHESMPVEKREEVEALERHLQSDERNFSMPTPLKIHELQEFENEPRAMRDVPPKGENAASPYDIQGAGGRYPKEDAKFASEENKLQNGGLKNLSGALDMLKSISG